MGNESSTLTKATTRHNKTITGNGQAGQVDSHGREHGKRSKQEAMRKIQADLNRLTQVWQTKNGQNITVLEILVQLRRLEDDRKRRLEEHDPDVQNAPPIPDCFLLAYQFELTKLRHPGMSTAAMIEHCLFKLANRVGPVYKKEYTPMELERLQRWLANYDVPLPEGDAGGNMNIDLSQFRGDAEAVAAAAKQADSDMDLSLIQNFTQVIADIRPHEGRAAA